MDSLAFSTPNERAYPRAEEIANSVSHGIGALGSAAALSLLVTEAARHGGGAEIAAYAIFGASLVLLFSMSTIYHALRSPRAKKVFEVLDHASIYVLIAGTYTAFCASALEGRSALTLLSLVWGIALAGCVFKALFIDKFRIVSTLGYLVMGWLILPFLSEVKAGMDSASFLLLGAGGLFYSIGAIFYLAKKVPWFHPLWHVFVLCGAASHVLSALLVLRP